MSVLPAVLGTLPVSKSGLNLTDRFFPLHSPNSFSEKDPLNQKLADREAAIRSFYATASMPIPNEASSSEPLFPGQQYKIYSSTNFDNSLPSDYTRVLQLVSGVTGIHASVIEDAVRRLEHSIGKRELGWKAKHLPTSQAASQGREAMMWGRLRDKGGVPPWPRDLLPSVKTEEPEKERAILEPKFRG